MRACLHLIVQRQNKFALLVQYLCPPSALERLDLDSDLNLIAYQRGKGSHAEVAAPDGRPGIGSTYVAVIDGMNSAVKVVDDEVNRPGDAEHGQFAVGAHRPVILKLDVVRLEEGGGIFHDVEEILLFEACLQLLKPGVDGIGIDGDVDMALVCLGIENDPTGGSVETSKLRRKSQMADLETREGVALIDRIRNPRERSPPARRHPRCRA